MARKTSPAQLQREIDAVLRRPRANHASRLAADDGLIGARKATEPLTAAQIAALEIIRAAGGVTRHNFKFDVKGLNLTTVKSLVRLGLVTRTGDTYTAVPRRDRSHHATRRAAAADNGWLVARDAILELDPDRAADIVNEILAMPSYPKPSRAFKKSLHDTTSNVRESFERRVPDWESKLGKAEFKEQAPGVMGLYVPGHGYFSAPVLVYNRYKKQSRKSLLNKILRIYEGIDGKGDKAAHWKGYDKDYLAMIIADSSGEEA